MPAVVAGPPLDVGDVPLLSLPPPHADAMTVSNATAATAIVARDLGLRTTVPPDSSRELSRHVRPILRTAEAENLPHCDVGHRPECNGGTYGWLRALSITLGVRPSRD